MFGNPFRAFERPKQGIAASSSSHMQRTARLSLPAGLGRSGAADAAIARSRATSLEEPTPDWAWLAR